MKNTIKPIGKSLGIIALLVMALMFSFVTLVSCATGVDGNDGKPGQKVYIGEDGYWWYVNGGRVKDDAGNEVRAYMRNPVPGDFTLEGQGYTQAGQLNQTYGNVKQINLMALPGMSQGSITYKFQAVSPEETSDPVDSSEIDVDSDLIPSTYYTSSGISYNEDDGLTPPYVRKNGEITAADKLVQLPVGTYRIWFSITRDNKYYYEADDVPIPSLRLKITAAEVKKSDFAFISEVNYTGEPVTNSQAIVKGNRADLESLPVTLTYYSENSAVLTPMGDPPTNVGRYKVKVEITSPDIDNWYGLDEDGEQTDAISLILDDILEIKPRYPNGADYLALTPVKAYRLKPGSASDPKLETVHPEVQPPPIPGARPHYSTGARTITNYSKDADADSPAYGPSNVPPVMPGTYTVTFDVGFPVGYPDADKNWNEGKGLTTTFIVIPDDPFDTIAEFKVWLQARPQSDPSSYLYYSVAFTNSLDDLLGDVSYITDGGSIGNILKTNKTRNVKLDLTAIDSDITEIGAHYFDTLVNLYGVKLPDSITTIGEYAFFTCANLEEVVLGDGITSIGQYAFANDAKISSITFPDSLSRPSVGIGANAFQNCVNLTYISIPGNVSIADSAFASEEFLSKYRQGDGGIYDRSPDGVWTKRPGSDRD